MTAVSDWSDGNLYIYPVKPVLELFYKQRSRIDLRERWSSFL